MMLKGKQGPIWWFSFPLAILVAFSAWVGLTSPGFYATETANWKAQSEGQDLANLFLVTPALLVTAFYAYREKKGALQVWAGVVSYLLYTFLIYCFSVHFNQLFLVYCAVLGLSFFSLLWFLADSLQQKPETGLFSDVPHRITSLYLMLIAVLFYFLWLSEIVPSLLNNTVPETVITSGLFTNPVQVIDLAVVLPGIFVTALFLRKKRRIGYILAPAILAFMILMDCTIGGLIFIMKRRGLGGDMNVALIMAALAVLTSLLLAFYIRKIKNPAAIVKLPG